MTAASPASLSSGQQARLTWLHEQLAAQAFPTAAQLAARFGVSDTAACRDLDFLKYICKAPVQFDYEGGGYTYTGPFDLPQLDFNSGELAGLLVLSQLRRAYGGTNFDGSLEKALGVLAGNLAEYVTVDLDSLDQILQVDIEPLPQLDLRIFQSLLLAIRSHESIIIRYFSGQKATVVEKPCDPYHLLNFKDNWYLVAFCHEKSDYRDFLCSRIMSVEHTNVTFLPDPDFSLDEHKRTSQLFASDAPEIEVVAEFDKFAAHWIRLKQIHPSQQVLERSDGSLEVSFKVNSMENLMRWILSFGEHARILAPLELQDRVRRTIGKMNYLYNRF